ncbi:hypothetical protein ROHU_023413 [Labeo rohita]|uniref:Uncharacterized protein n=1 Tax=Labeo rohita TaxID=84645 RepID=A0A498MT31_LABRO|nr:hypothetical protein ROHU_023413 [Labeo rohita]
MSPSGDLDRDELDTDDTANMALAFTGDQIDQEDRSSPHLSTADIETKSPSGDLDLQLDPDDTASIVLPLAAICGENESEVRPDSSCANLELMSSSGRSVLTTELQPSDMDQQFTCDSSSEDSVSGDDSEIPDIPEDDPFRQIGFDTDMDSVLMSADSKARPAMQNTTQFNGYFGCGFCLHPGTLVEKQVKYTVTDREYPDREVKKMLADMEQAVTQNRSVRGVKGPSPLINMPFFDIVWGFVPDYMHAVLLGVIRQLTELLLNNTDQPYYIGSPNTMMVLENRIKDIKPPHLITRQPRPLAEFKYWKASEWRAWLLFYSLPVLNDVLQPRYVNHLGLLVSALFLLLNENITFQDINKADNMLFEFVARFCGGRNDRVSVRKIQEQTQGARQSKPSSERMEGRDKSRMKTPERLIARRSTQH